MSAYGYEDALAMVEAEIGQTFTWNSADYPCTIGDRTEGKTLDIGGFDPTADLVLVVRTANFATYPVAQDTVVVSARTLRISSVVHSPCGSFLVLNLVDDNRGA
jgi:hypothetical protein